jgi:trigger factor
MKIKIKKLQGTAREINIEMPKSTVDEAVEEILAEIKKTAKIPGFRPGNAPLDIIRKKHQDEAVEEARNRLVARAYQDALEKHEIDPAGYPEIFDLKLKPSGELSFKAKVDAQPEVDLKKYDGINVTGKKVDVSEEELSGAMEKIRGMFAEFTDKEGVLAPGDFAIADVESFFGEEAISKKRENMWIEVSKENSLLGIGEQLEGLGKGGIKNVDVTLPENYPDKKYAGKKATFKIEIKEVKEKKLPEMNDEMALKAGKANMSELRDEVKDQIMSKKQENENISRKNQILTDLIKRHRFELPQTMVARQFKVLMERAENELVSKGLDEKAVSEHKDKLQASLLKEAGDKVRVYFILDKVSEREGVKVTDEEIDAWIMALAGSYNKPFEEVKKYYTERDLLGGLYEQLKEDKTLDILLEKATVSFA